MKNQNDMIVIIVTIVLAAIAISAFAFTKPVVTQPAPPAQIVTKKAELPTGDVQFASSLPGASSATGGQLAGGGARGGAPVRGGGAAAAPPSGPQVSSGLTGASAR